MTDDAPPPQERYPLAPVLVIDRPDMFKAFADPLRLRILRAFYVKDTGRALSGKDLMKVLGEEKNRRIYYHLGLLEDAGLLKKAFEKRRRNLTEAYYTPVASRLQLSPEILQPLDGVSPWLDLALAFLGAVQADLPLLDNAGPDESLLLHRQVSLDAKSAAEMRTELRAVVERYEALSHSGPDAENHRITLFGYPVQHAPGSEDDY